MSVNLIYLFIYNLSESNKYVFKMKEEFIMVGEILTKKYAKKGEL